MRRAESFMLRILPECCKYCGRTKEECY